MSDLSPREEEIVDLIANGRTTKEIAGELSIAESTVNWHVSNALTKLNASTRAEAVAKVIRESGPGVTPLDRRETDPTERLPIVDPAEEPIAGGWARRLVVGSALAVAILALVAASAIAGSSVLERRPSSYPSSAPSASSGVMPVTPAVAPVPSPSSAAETPTAAPAVSGAPLATRPPIATAPPRTDPLPSVVPAIGPLPTLTTAPLPTLAPPTVPLPSAPTLSPRP